MQKEMKDAGVPMEFVAYPGAVHSFTVNVPSTNPAAKYNESADKASWEAMSLFLKSTIRS